MMEIISGQLFNNKGERLKTPHNMMISNKNEN